MTQKMMRQASIRWIGCVAFLMLLLCMPRTSSAQRGGGGSHGGHSGFSSGTHFGAGTSFHSSGGGTSFRPSSSFGGSGGFRSGSSFGGSFSGRSFHSGGLFHDSFRFRPRNSFFFGFSFGGYYPYYYDPFWYPGYSYYPYPVYRTVYVDEHAYVERRYRDDIKYGDDDYYLHRRYSSIRPDIAVTDTIADIEKAFLNGDGALLERHVDTKESIRIYARDRSSKSLKASEYIDMTRDAFKDMKTVSYHLDRVQPAGNGVWSASGIHVLRAENGDEKRFEVNFVLRKAGDRWIIVEAGASATR
jgi:hypothetical protein